jgi:hypothetical protein
VSAGLMESLALEQRSKRFRNSSIVRRSATSRITLSK